MMPTGGHNSVVWQQISFLQGATSLPVIQAQRDILKEVPGGVVTKKKIANNKQENYIIYV